MCTSMSICCYAQNDAKARYEAQAEEAKALYESGKSKFSKFDDSQMKMQLKQAVDTNEMSSNLMSGYEDFLKALPLDTIPEIEKDGSPKIDKKTGKQKVKTKYSKNIVENIVNHHNDFLAVGQFYYGKNDYLNTAKAWEIYVSLPSAEFLGDKKPVLADSTAGMYYFNIGILYYYQKDNQKALDAFLKALKKGYSQTADVKNMIKLEYSLIIDEYLTKEQYDKCEEKIDEAIATDPSEALYVMYKAILVETQTKDMEKAIEYYKKASELDPTLSLAQFHMGRYYYNKAVNVLNAKENENLNTEELGKLMDPYCLQAKPYLDKAVELDTEGSNSEAKRLQSWINDRLAK